MAKAELTVARTKRGECVSCGRKCYRKKLFKMIPLDEPGKILNGRCLNCKPLQAKDVPTMPSNSSNPHSSGRNLSGRSNRSIIINSSISEENNRRMAMRKKKSSSHRSRNHQSSWKSNSKKEVTNDGKEHSTTGKSKSPPGRTHSNLSTARNRFNSSHSSLSRTTVDTAITTRPSIASISIKAARKNNGGISTLSIESTSSVKDTAKSDKKHRKGSTGGRTRAITESSICETSVTKSPEISWTPPPHQLEFGGSDNEIEDLNENLLHFKSNANIQPPSRLNSFKSIISATSKHCRPTREELEQAALTLMAAREHGLTSFGGPLYEDMFEDLPSSDPNHNSRPDGGIDSSRKNLSFHAIDSTTGRSDKMKYAGENDNDTDSKLKSETSLNTSLLESDRSPDAEHIQSFPKSRDQDHDLEQNSSIAESNVCSPKLVSTREYESNQRSCNHPKEGILNRGGAFQPRNANCHGRPGPGTHVFAGSIGTMSSVSSIGEDDHLFRQNSLEQKQSPIPHRRQNLPRMGSFSRYRQGSCQTLGSLSTIEVINEEDTKIQYSLEDSIHRPLPVDRLSPPSVASSVQPVAEVDETSAHHFERKEPPTYDNDNRLALNLPMGTTDLAQKITSVPTEQDEDIISNENETCNDFVNHDASIPTKQEKGDEVNSKNLITCKLFKDQLVFLRESSESPDQTRKALEILSECETADIGEGKENRSVVETVLTSMQNHTFSYDVQLWGCRAIWNMISSRDWIQNAFIQAGATAVITKAMNQFIKIGEDLHEEAIALLSNFAIDSSNLDNLLCKGVDVVESIITSMGQYPGNAGLQRKGCEGLAALASHNDSTLRLRIMDKGAGEAILFNAVAMHSDDFIVQKSAMLAVRNLSIDCEENQNRLLELGVVDPILSAMKKHRSVAGLQEAGVGAISIVAGSNVETRKVIESNGGIKLILRAVLDHSNISTEKECYVRALLTLSLGSYDGNNSESRSSEENIKAAAAIGAVIDAFDSPREKNKPSKLALAIHGVVIAMEAHENVSAVQEVGCVILGGLAELVEEGIATDSDQTKMDIVDEGALDAINMAMVLHRHEGRVQERACALLLGLAIEENYASISAAVGIQLLEDAADNFPGRCRDLAKRLIQRLIEDEGSKED